MMKRSAAALLAAVVLCLNAGAQAPAPKAEDQLAALVKELQAQQTKIAENQAQIDARIGAIAESIRQARIYASRAGH